MGASVNVAEDRLLAMVGTRGVDHRFATGDALFVPPDTPLSIGCSDDARFEAIFCFPVGAKAVVDGHASTPP